MKITDSKIKYKQKSCQNKGNKSMQPELKTGEIKFIETW